MIHQERGFDRYRRVWIVYLVVSIVALAAYVLIVPDSLIQSIDYDVIAVFAVAAMVVGIRINRPDHALPWWLMTIAISLFTLGDILWTMYEALVGGDPPFPWFADGAYLAGYPFLAAGLTALVRARCPGGDRLAPIDALAIAVSSGSLSWVFLISPNLTDHSLTLAGRIVSFTYPVADLVLLGIVVRFSTSGGFRRASLAFLLAGTVLMLLGDSVFGVSVLGGAVRWREAVDGLLLSSYIAFGAAALHPSMRPASRSTPATPPSTFSSRGLVLLGAIALAGPVLLTIRYLQGDTSSFPVIVATSAILFILTLARVGVLALGLDAALRDRAAAQAQLESSESRFRALVQHASDIISIFDRDGTPRYVSPSIQRVLGHPPENRIGESGGNDLHPDDLARAEAFYADVANVPGGQATSEFRMRHADGAWHWFEVVATNLLADPTVGGIVANARDVTDRKAAEAALNRERDLLHLLMDNLPDLVFFKDRDARYIRVNRADATFMGLADPAEAIGKTDSDLRPSPLSDARVADDLAIMARRIPVVDRLDAVRDVNGEARWLSTTTAPTLDAGGMVSGIVGIARDVTDRERADLAVQVAEMRFRNLFNDAPVMYVITGNDAGSPVITDCNELFVRVIGHERDAVIGRSMVDFLSTASRDALPAAFAQSLRGERTEGGRQLIARDGRLLDVFMQAQPEIDADGVIIGSRATFMDITARISLETQLAHQAFHDPLTGLPNRMLFSNRLDHALARAVRGGDDLAVLFVDLDSFKVVNDSLGHGFGDKLLVTVAERLSECVRAVDTVARLGGDEFTVLLEQSGSDQAAGTAHRIALRLAEPLELDGHALTITASIGIACKGSPLDTSAELLRDADVAMYAAKQRGKAQFALFDPGMHRRAWERLELESDLRLAITRGEFRVHYQPIVDLASGETWEVEALIRWEHPVRGLVSPGEFIHLAEETGLILPIGWWVMAEACRQVREWQRSVPQTPPLSVSVNLTQRMFHHPALVEDVWRILTESGLDPACLKLEITEGVMMKDGDGAIETLRRLKEMGAQLAVDDFGTGYSSLANLQRLPIDVLKIDRVFVGRIDEDLESMEIVRLVIGLAKTLGLTVVSEGIETAPQLETLRALGCDRGQGFWLSRPMSADDTLAYLTARSRDVATSDDRRLSLA